jgi:hypothetical protein
MHSINLTLCASRETHKEREESQRDHSNEKHLKLLLFHLILLTENQKFSVA